MDIVSLLQDDKTRQMLVEIFGTLAMPAKRASALFGYSPEGYRQESFDDTAGRVMMGNAPMRAGGLPLTRTTSYAPGGPPELSYRSPVPARFADNTALLTGRIMPKEQSRAHPALINHSPGGPAIAEQMAPLQVTSQADLLFWMMRQILKNAKQQ